MKTIRYLFYMMLLLSIIEVQGNNYSIDYFLEYLHEKGYYALIQGIKKAFGDDVAIAFCEYLVENSDCQIAIRVYMDGGSGSGGSGGSQGKESWCGFGIDPDIYDVIIEIEDKYNTSQEMRKLIEVILCFYDSLIATMSDEEIIDFIERIIKNPSILEAIY